MGNNPNVAPRHATNGFDHVGLLLRVSLVIAYTFLGLSCLMFMGMSFGAAFLATFTVENGLEEPIYVTPVGTVGPNGARHPLPVSHYFVVAIPSTIRGGFELQPNETVSITYDMDDINFSEIVVEKVSGPIGQLIANPNPTSNQYHAPTTKHFVVQQGSLVPVPASVLNAATRGRQRSHAAAVLLSLLVVPWPVVLVLSWLQKKHALTVNARDENVAEQSGERADWKWFDDKRGEYPPG